MRGVELMRCSKVQLATFIATVLPAAVLMGGCGSTDPEVSPELVFPETSGQVSALLTERFESQVAALYAVESPKSIRDLEKWFPDPPPGENAAKVFENAFEHYVYPGERDYDNLPVVGEAVLPKPGHSMSTSMKETIRRYLDVNSRALRLLHKATATEHYRRPVDFLDELESFGRVSTLTGALVQRFITREGDPLSRSLEHHSGMRQAARLFMLEAVLSAENGDYGAAADSIVASLGLARALAKEPFVLSQLVRYACQGISIGTIEYILNRTTLSEESLHRIQSGLASSEFPKALARSVSSEILIFPEEQVDSEFARQMHEQYIALDARYMAQVRLAAAAAAIERFRLAHGYLPDTLAELTPGLLNSVPLDPFDEKPVRYKKLSEGYILFCVGRDGQDDFETEPVDQRESHSSPDIAFIVRR